jgi:hypothetical protein
MISSPDPGVSRLKRPRSTGTEVDRAGFAAPVKRVSRFREERNPAKWIPVRRKIARQRKESRQHYSAASGRGG